MTNTELIRQEIERLLKFDREVKTDYYIGRRDAEKEILDFIDSLQHEQPEVGFKPLDADFERDAVSFCFDSGLNTTPHIAKTIARHFYELGLNARKEE